MSTETKELLTLAARAMGGEYLYAPSVNMWMLVLPGGAKRPWNPLTSADDLVEMECQMMIDVSQFDDRVAAMHFTRHPPLGRDVLEADEYLTKHNNSRRAARAMASLRVVAEIGRRMESGK